MGIRVGTLILVSVAPFLATVAPGPAQARVKKVVVRQGPFHIRSYQVRYTDKKSRHVRAPKISGHIVKMHARVVDRRGRRIPVNRVMLHHVLYKNMGRFPGDRRERICGHKGQSFYGTGEENQALRLPKGYGYRIRKGDRWSSSWMLMNHTSRTDTAYIEYTAWIETERKLRPATPYWLRVTGCRGTSDPIYNIAGGGAPGSTDSRTQDFVLPRVGMLVAANAHVHGGAKGLRLTQPRCGDRLLMRSRSLYGLPSHPYYHVRPVLHEPGPIATSWPRTAKGIPLGPGEPIRLTSAYDSKYQHTRVMGIMHLYVWHGRRPRAASCAPLRRT